MHAQPNQIFREQLATIIADNLLLFMMTDRACLGPRQVV